jgi:hypothetical protein
MKKLDLLPDDALLGAFMQEKRKELGAVAKPLPAKPAMPPPLPAPPVVDPQLAVLRNQAGKQEAALAQLERELTTARTALEQAQTSVAQLDRERRLADKRAAEARDRVRELELALAQADKTPLWAERGLAQEEVLSALALLARTQPQALFSALMTPDPKPLAQVLNDRLALVCGAPTCHPSGETHAFLVPTERCELCGGSDLRLAFRAFAHAMEAARLPSVTFIGGSPAYREALRHLRRELKPVFELDAVAKKRPGEGKRAQAARGLIVIWGGSEVDHDTTIHYQNSGDLVLSVSHRGLSGILPRLTAELQRRR